MSVCAIPASFDNGIACVRWSVSPIIWRLNSYATDGPAAVAPIPVSKPILGLSLPSAGFELPIGLSLSAGVRLDEKTLDVRRTDLNATSAQIVSKLA